MMPSLLASKLAAGEFVITTELAPPRGCDLSGFLRSAGRLAPYVDAINITDNQGANMRMTPLAGAAALISEGIEPIMQLTCRDRNRLALQSDLLGAASFGVRNILALTGDYIGCGDHGSGRSVFDLDSVFLLQAISCLNAGMDINGVSLSGGCRTEFFAGAAAAPEAEPFAPTRPKLLKKAAAGAGFFQTQAVFDPKKLSAFREYSNSLGVRVIAGILVLRTAKMAEYINRNIPGLKIPEAVVERLRGSGNPSEEGVRIAAGIATACRGFCDGVHVMAMGQDDLVPRVLEHINEQRG